MVVKDPKPTKWATANGCRPFHGLDGVLNLTQGSAFGSTLGFMLTPAPRALEKSFQNNLLKLITPSRSKHINLS
jgi:hypothetical protein